MSRERHLRQPARIVPSSVLVRELRLVDSHSFGYGLECPRVSIAARAATNVIARVGAFAVAGDVIH